jgi:WD40 repeat protein
MISVWESATGVRTALLRGHKAEITALAFTPDGRTLASASTDHTLKLWHVPTWRELGTLRRERLFTFLAFAGDGPSLFAGEYRKSLHILRAPPDAATKSPAAFDDAAPR